MNAPNQHLVSDKQSLDSLISTIRIPPRPSLLVEVQRELNKDEPSARVLAKVISNDVALAAALMKLANSPFFGLRLKAQSVEHAVDLLGINQTGIVMTGIIARQSITNSKNSLRKFWDFSSKRAQAMSSMVKQFRVCSPDVAHTYGLFCDIGVPILMDRFPRYLDTWTKGSANPKQGLTEFEDGVHQTNHAAIGSLLARTWGLPEQVSTAILLHHDYQVLEDMATPESVRGLIALTALAEYAIQKYEGQDNYAEWQKACLRVCQFLAIGIHDAEDLCEELQETLNAPH